MLNIREYCYIENRKVADMVQDWLVREYYNINNTLSVETCEDTNTFSNIITYLNREVKKLEEYEEQGLTKSFLKSFFETVIKENITTSQYWVNCLDTHMEEKYIEDGEIMYGYESDYWAPLAIRGTKEEVIIFIKKLLDKIGFDFEELDLDLSELESEFEDGDYEEEGGSIDRPYYEQRSRNFTL